MDLNVTVSIAAPVAIVFHVFTDIVAIPDVIRSVQRIEPIGTGPIGKGTRFRETRVLLGRSATEEREITVFEPKNSYSVESISQGMHFHTTYEFRTNGARTEVIMKMNTRRANWKGWITAALMRIFAGSIKRVIANDHADLTHACEERAALAARAAPADSA